MTDLASKLASETRLARVEQDLDRFADRLYPLLLRAAVGLAMLVLLAWMLAGIGALGLALFRGGLAQWTGAAEQAIVDGLILLALLEVVRTLQVYLKLGRVRVTFILDTALVVLIGELMGLWFKEYSAQKLMLGMLAIVVLVALRVATTRYSPDSRGF